MTKKRSTFSHLVTVRAEVADPPLTVSLTVKYPFLRLPCDSYKNETTLNYTGDDFDLLVSPPGLNVGKKHVSEIFNI